MVETDTQKYGCQNVLSDVFVIKMLTSREEIMLKYVKLFFSSHLFIYFTLIIIIIHLLLFFFYLYLLIIADSYA